MIEEEQKQFDYCNKVDLHALDFNSPINTIVAVAAEHGFRGIVVPMSRLEALIKEINRPLFGDKNIVPICTIDYPYGSSSIDVRTYSIHSAKEAGAKEVEVVAPYNLIVEKDFRKIYEDAQSLVSAALKVGVGIKYVLDQNSEYVDESVRTKLCRIIASTKIPSVSTSLGYFDTKVDHGDSVLRMRNIKSKVGCEVKVFINTSDPNEFALYPKAGADIIGLPWNKAPYLVHAYEDMVDKKS